MPPDTAVTSQHHQGELLGENVLEEANPAGSRTLLLLSPAAVYLADSSQFIVLIG